MKDMGKGENKEIQRCYPVLETDSRIAISNTESHWIKVDQTDRGGIGGVATNHTQTLAPAGIRGCFRREPAILSMVMSEHTSNATVLLTALERGDPKAADKLLELVYQELRQLATRKMSQEPPNQTLQPTALVHEAWLRLVGSENPSFENRAHFFSAAAEAMRRILIDRARRRHTQRHGGGYQRVDLNECDLAAPQAEEEILAVNEALDKLAGTHPVQAEVVKLRYFGGRTNEEIAQILNISLSSVKNYWAFARAWLLQEIKGI
jgi:RNA polymerase sigma factor (TIGR02999 family)